jgi:hypothetical protein
MKKILVAAALGAITMFAWQYVSWGVLPLQEGTFQDFPDEQQAVEANAQLLKEDGTYFLPAPQASEYSAANGPVLITFYHKEGVSRSLLMRIIIGFLIDFVALFLICGCLRFVIDLLDNFLKRFVIILGIGLAAGILTHAYMWNWFFMNDHFTLMLLVDFLGGWILAAVVIAYIMKPVHKYIVP